jgi:hypothetical protein
MDKQRTAEIAYSAACRAARVMPVPLLDLPLAVRALWLAAVATLEDPKLYVQPTS